MTASAAELQAMYDAALRRQRENYGAAATTIEALMYSLRRGVAALSEPDCQRRLADLNDDQMREVAIRLQKLKTEIAPAWSADQVDKFFEARAKL